jgi:hypothetical protein
MTAYKVNFSQFHLTWYARSVEEVREFLSNLQNDLNTGEYTITVDEPKVVG